MVGSITLSTFTEYHTHIVTRQTRFLKEHKIVAVRPSVKLLYG